MNKKYHFISMWSLLILSITLPLSVEAATFSSLLTSIQNIIDDLLPILASLALLGFFYGLTQYVFSAGDEEGREKGKQYIIAGIIALFLMASIGGIINFLVEATGTGSGNIPIPGIDITN